MPLLSARLGGVMCAAVLAGCGYRAAAPSPAKPTLSIAGWVLTRSRDPQPEILRQFQARTGIAVLLVAGSDSVTEREQQYYEMLGRHAAAPDVYGIDVTWPDTFGEHFIDLRPALEAEVRQLAPALVENDVSGGRLVAVPYFSDVGLLYYREDLLRRYGYRQPPRTWTELEQMAARIQAGERAGGAKSFWGYVWPGSPYEGLTCVAYEWQVSEGGGHIVEPDGRITVDNADTVAALLRGKRWIGTISPPTTLTYRDHDARNLFESGNAAFMRMWFDTYRAVQTTNSPVHGRVAVAPLPAGRAQRASALGGWQLAVSKYSPHQKEAVELIRFLIGAPHQVGRAVANGMPPTMPALFDDPRVIQANPQLSTLRQVYLGGAVARPSKVAGARYGQVSEVYFRTVHSILSGKVEAEAGLRGLHKQIASILGAAEAGRR